MKHSHKLWLGIALLLVPFLAALAAQPPGAELDEMEPGDPLTAEITRLAEDIDPQTDSALKVDEGQNRLSPIELEQFLQQSLAVFSLADAKVQQIPTRRLEQRSVPIRLGSDDFIISLSPYSMRADNFQLLVQDATGALVPTEPPEPATYRGSLIGQPSAKVAASILDGKLLALIVTDTQTWAVQPLAPSVLGAPDNLHVVYRASDVIGGHGICGVDNTMVPIGAGDQNSAGPVNEDAPRGVVFGRTEIAFDADFEFFQLNGNSVANTMQDIEMVMNQVGLIYQNQVSICYAMTGIIVRTAEPDPYNATSANGRLCEFKNFWNANVTIQRDVAHLMTGIDLDGSTIGVAFLGVICNVQGSTGVPGCVSANQGYGLSESMFRENDPFPGTTSLTERVGLTAHELGHNWNACHCNNGGCPAANPNCCTGGPPDADCGIMWSAIGAQQSSLLFSGGSVTKMTAHRNSRSCLDTCFNPVFVDWNNPLSGNGSISNPFRTVREGVSYVPVGGQVIISVGTYPETITINKAVTLTATPPGAVVTIGQ